LTFSNFIVALGLELLVYYKWWGERKAKVMRLLCFERNDKQKRRLLIVKVFRNDDDGSDRRIGPANWSGVSS